MPRIWRHQLSLKAEINAELKREGLVENFKWLAHIHKTPFCRDKWALFPTPAEDRLSGNLQHLDTVIPDTAEGKNSYL